MTPKEREVMELALEALERYQVKRQDFERFADVITAIKAALEAHKALAQPAVAEQHKQSTTCGEPVAWESILGAIARGWCYEENANKTMDSDLAAAIAKEVQALYTTPYVAICGSTTAPLPQRTWVGLDWNEMPEIYMNDKAFEHGVQWAETKLKEKNTK